MSISLEASNGASEAQRAISKMQGNCLENGEVTKSHTVRRKPVYEVVAGEPTWGRLSRLAVAAVADLVTAAIVRAVKVYTKSGSKPYIAAIRKYILDELPPSMTREVLELCLARDRFHCHHNPTECLSLEFWQSLYSSHMADVSVVHHEFAFPKTSNYPEIVENMKQLLDLVSQSNPLPPEVVAAAANQNPYLSNGQTNHAVPPPLPGNGEGAITTTTSFKLELKQCEMGFYMEDHLLSCLPRFRDLRVLELPALATDKLLLVIARYCTNLEGLNIQGSRGMVSDRGFANFVNALASRPVPTGQPTGAANLKKLDLVRCGLTQLSLLPLQRLTSLLELKVSTTMLDDILYACDGSPVMIDADPAAVASAVTGNPFPNGHCVLPSVNLITVESDNFVQMSINKVMSCLKSVFPDAAAINLVNCIACELHVTLTQHPTNITYMRETIHTLELISADYFNFPRLVYPCPNLESLSIEKPTNDVFNIDQQHVPFLYGNTVPFANLKRLKLSRISLTNLTHFLSNSRALKKFKVTNIGRRERPRWTDQRIQQIFPPDSVPCLEEFHVSCLPSEGFSTSDTHRYLHLTKATVAYLTETFSNIKSIGGIESWTPADTHAASLNAMLNTQPEKAKFSVFSI